MDSYSFCSVPLLSPVLGADLGDVEIFGDMPAKVAVDGVVIVGLHGLRGWHGLHGLHGLHGFGGQKCLAHDAWGR